MWRLSMKTGQKVDETIAHESFLFFHLLFINLSRSLHRAITTKMSLLISLALWFLYSAATAVGDGPGDASGVYNPCSNCTVCEFPCYPQAAPPPPSPPPPPPPQQPVVGPENCPPPPNLGSGSGSGSAQCCQYSPPGVNYTPVPYDNYSGTQSRISSATWSAAAVLLLQRLLFPYV